MWVVSRLDQLGGDIDLMEVQQLLFIVTDAVVCVGIMCSELDGCNIVCQSGLLLIIKTPQVHLRITVYSAHQNRAFYHKL